MPMSPQDVAARWAARTKSTEAKEKYKKGIQAVTESPMEAAAREKDRYVAGVQEAAASGKWERGLRRRTLTDWQQAASTKGVQNITTGVDAATAKQVAFYSELLPHTEMVKAAVRAMPKGTLEDSKARSIRAIELMAAFTRTR